MCDAVEPTPAMCPLQVVECCTVSQCLLQCPQEGKDTWPSGPTTTPDQLQLRTNYNSGPPDSRCNCLQLCHVATSYNSVMLQLLTTLTSYNSDFQRWTWFTWSRFVITFNMTVASSYNSQSCKNWVVRTFNLNHELSCKNFQLESYRKFLQLSRESRWRRLHIWTKWLMFNIESHYNSASRKSCKRQSHGVPFLRSQIWINNLVP